jgi:cephalosporin hydroxylase
VSALEPGGVRPSELPPPVLADRDQPLREYWRARAAQHTHDRYAGVPISKFPEDLRVYEHLLWVSRANVVIEIGAHFGGSALWFRDRLRTLERYGRVSRPLVVSVDTDVRIASDSIGQADTDWEATIALIEGNVLDPSLPDAVAARLPGDARCLVVEDSAHSYATTLAALRGFARFVPVNGFFIVEDGCVDVDDMRLSDEWPRGVLPALHNWLLTEQGRRFAVRRDLELYGVSCHPEGFLERVR